MRTQKIENGTLEVWTPDEVAKAMSEGRVVLVDVRTPQEYAHERIAGAMLLPMQDFDAAFLPDAGKPLVLHCGSGIRSARMAESMLAAGREKVAHMEGGMNAWKQAGLTYVGTDPATGAPKRMTSGS
ncbi:rhodanese-like domain-containing protein [Roseibacterium sp. SDUM158017]|uniref:rhodanese-like domain-containing protein n=1 Tax=Roseicyclus salinarum TaxID=3036773 RepID=UPI0024155742|nr:rhodanese-like domain-containing protein [Roseibacterium sp. SDUM158017]MDG4650270.1 rhodanese-like domain-containing protein [Roseibacterium sp. SDUM158017]